MIVEALLKITVLDTLSTQLPLQHRLANKYAAHRQSTSPSTVMLAASPRTHIHLQRATVAATRRMTGCTTSCDPSLPRWRCLGTFRICLVDKRNIERSVRLQDCHQRSLQKGILSLYCFKASIDARGLVQVFREDRLLLSLCYNVLELRGRCHAQG